MHKLETEKNFRQKKFAIMFSCYIFVFLFLSLMGYIGYYSATHYQELLNNNYNGRQKVLQSKNTRGTIFADNYDVLAQTVLDDAGDEVREYPFENIFSHVVGYTAKGKTGIEADYNYYLINSSLPITEKLDAENKEEKVPADNVVTTLNVNLQETVEKALGVYRGAVIVTEPSTGKILAMVSKPDFDPNRIASIWEDVVADTDSSSLLNRSTQGLYPPGSTFKIFSALEYIRENPATYENYSYQCNGSFTCNGDKISCYHGTKHGLVSFRKSFAKSCNSSFANIGVQLNKTSFAKTLDEMLFNQPLSVKFNYKESSIQVSEDTSSYDMMQTAIGQGKTQITPLQLNMVTGAIANGGKAMIPYVVDRIETAEKQVVKSYAPKMEKQIMTEEEAAILTDLMEDVVEEGTGSKLSGLSYTAAGKTGSAEYNATKGDSHAWFTGFAPVENPKICVTVIIEGAGSGGDYAVPIAKRVFDAYLD